MRNASSSWLRRNLAQSDTAVITDLVALYKTLGGGWEVLPEQ